LTLANSLWVRVGKTIRHDFVRALDSYGCLIKEVDFQSPGSASELNSWLGQATGGLIKKKGTGGVSSDAAAVLLSVASFSGRWKLPFDTAKTRSGTFYRSDGTETRCEMMWLLREDLAYIATDLIPRYDPAIACYLPNIVGLAGRENAMRQVAAVTLPYASGRFSMTIIVPYKDYYDSTATIDTLLCEFSHEKWQASLPFFTVREFDFGLPKFRFSDDVDLKEPLAALGVRAAFDPHQADFSHMFSDGEGWIGKVGQETHIQVEEKGTLAVSVTEMMWPDSIPVAVVADRPFVVVIRETSSQVILFMGKIANPVWVL